MASAGRILIIPRGDYKANSTYEKLDLVKYKGTSWLAKKNATGIEPSEANAEYWHNMFDFTLVDNLTTEGTGYALDARQGKVLMDAISETNRNLASETSTRTAEIAIERARIDAFTKLGEGSTTGDSELIDARIGADGKTYTNLGEANRTQFANLKSDLIEVKDDVSALQSDLTNRLDKEAISIGYYVDPSTGVLSVNENYYTTDFIPIRDGETLIWYEIRNGCLATIPQCRFLATYDKGKNVIVQDTDFDGSHTYTQSGNVAFIRVTFYTTTPQDIMMICNTYPFPYFLEYGEVFNPKEFYKADSDVSRAFHFNRLRLNESEVGKYPNYTTGMLTDNETLIASNAFEIRAGETFSVYDENMNVKDIRMWAVYDKDGHLILDLSGENGTSVTNNTEESVFARIGYYTSAGNVMIAPVGTPYFLNEGVYVLKTTENEMSEQIKSIVGGNVCSVTADSITRGTIISLTEFPRYIKKNSAIVFEGFFDSFEGLSIGHGGEGEYSARWLSIDSTNLVINSYYTSTGTNATVAHGLMLSDFIIVSLSYDNDGVMYIDIITNGGSFTYSMVGGFGSCGVIFANPHQNMTNVKLSAGCKDFACPLWMIGDSYFGGDNTRVFGQLRNLGFTNYLLIGQAGLGSFGGYADFLRALNFGTPNVLVWYMGMNDGATADTYSTYLGLIKTVCEEHSITLILNKVPTVPTIAKEAIAEVIDASGCRYIDSYSAVGSDTSGAWYDGMLSSDGVHPTEHGAKVLAGQMLVDVPEIIAYGRD